MESEYTRFTIFDIARIAGVSITTVSRVINHRGVSEDTKDRILKVIQKYEYYPNNYAQYLGRCNNGKKKNKSQRRNIVRYGPRLTLKNRL